MKKINISRVLDNIDKKSMNKIAEASDVSQSTVFNILKAFPLWDFCRDPDKYKESH
jgi:hypothetical protein